MSVCQPASEQASTTFIVLGGSVSSTDYSSTFLEDLGTTNSSMAVRRTINGLQLYCIALRFGQRIRPDDDRFMQIFVGFFDLSRPSSARNVAGFYITAFETDASAGEAVSNVDMRVISPDFSYIADFAKGEYYNTNNELTRYSLRASLSVMGPSTALELPDVGNGTFCLMVVTSKAMNFETTLTKEYITFDLFDCATAILSLLGVSISVASILFPLRPLHVRLARIFAFAPSAEARRLRASPDESNEAHFLSRSVAPVRPIDKDPESAVELEQRTANR